MFVRRLVSGVRSSCEASATSCRCARVDSSSAASIVLKLVASRLELVLPVCVDPLGEVARLGDRLGRLGQAPHRGERGARDEEPERRGDRDAAGRDQEQEERDPVERVVDLAQRPRDLDARTGRRSGTVSTRTSASADRARR